MSHGKQKRSRKKARRSELSYTPLSKHNVLGKSVVPPMGMLKREIPLAHADWTGERLPEMLWASLLVAVFGRDVALKRFREVAAVVGYAVERDPSKKEVLSDVRLSGLASWPASDFEAFAKVVRPGRAIFAALTTFQSLPARDRWLSIVDGDGDPNDLEPLKHAVAQTLFHQSQEATDCRWARLLPVLCAGQLHFPSEEMIREIVDYPNFGDMRKVRPTIRAHEGVLDALASKGEAPSPTTWAADFWVDAFEKTRDDHDRLPRKTGTARVGITTDQLRKLRDAVLARSKESTLGSAVAPRHEGAFGIALYALTIMDELLSLGNAIRALGRMGLRSLIELRITVAYLRVNDTPDMWEKFRMYGAGQAKLAYLKLLETDELPSFITVEALERLANEDLWHEFLEIQLGNWDGTDLRKMSDHTALKADVYDRYYDWTSAFVHGNWAAIRDAVYDVCLNPLHRLHRIPADTVPALPDVIQDAFTLLRGILATLDELYPGTPGFDLGR